ncbi:phosphotransferase family protein [Legionella oakridgensis]|uniref:Homoserine kinase n=2 Tax=Legionella oakridgensis TaxID=29423 RepID=A0A0W0WXK3_9GAMM|nr:aminoglycoside phosphotransferase family protein [Legionella oakridgensis]AHE67607.1 putative aminoglycoside phosphotransferase [Legionella oakridgensis ATCC 33761 = DSM 21215]ETO92846.1 putative aminoglycoside phosphotransferase [Legionella oakridgensis RV-2-2007]KTD37047.1 Homoserine kinase [Legionella oakridgensis]STY20644.1 Phosphotransferase enzyme family [Legionella longbeachae]
MTFKQHWEKTNQQFQPSVNTIATMIKLAFPAEKLSSFKIISGGCANLNIQIQLASRHKPPFILRIYLRDKEAAYREQKLGLLLKHTIPIPQIYFIGHDENYLFAIAEYLPGITLRDLLLTHRSYDLSAIMVATGNLLAEIQSHQFSAAGFFDKELNVIQPTSQHGYMEFAQQCLRNTMVMETLGPEILTTISHYLERFNLFFPDEGETHLVHGDYDPANILVAKTNNEWQVSGILDWEFSFAGSPLFDVANMLRYAHHMPKEFEDSFLQGLTSKYRLPEHWRTTIHLLNLMSLLDCLARCPKGERPNQCKDIRLLIEHIMNRVTP